MPDTTPPPHLHALPDWLNDASQAPWNYNFTALLRALSAHAHHTLQADGSPMPPVGESQRPQQEGFRLGQQASLAFAPREIAQVFARDGRTHIDVLGLGMLGPNGPLPIHFTEMVRESSQARRDNTLANFLNLFHHRYFSLLYRAWSQSQAAAGLDRADAETFTNYVARLCGDEPSEVQHSALAPHTRWASTAHRIRGPRDPEGLVRTLQRFFGVRVVLEEFLLHWTPLDSEDTSIVGKPRASGNLGSGAILGEFIPDRQSRFRLVIGPLDLRAYLRLTPAGHSSGQDLPALVELVRSFIGFEYAWEVELRISTQAAPACSLGDGGQLGWSTWAGTNPSAQESIVGMVLEPERYVKSLRRATSHAQDSRNARNERNERHARHAGEAREARNAHASAGTTATTTATSGPAASAPQ
jgi:type VI secretion system protein ImpH